MRKKPGLEATILAEAVELTQDWKERTLALREVYEEWARSPEANLAQMCAVFGATRQLVNAVTDISEIITGMHSMQANVHLPPLFAEFAESTSIKNAYGTIYVKQRKTASVQDKEKAFEWLREVGLGDLIQPAVNAQTLSAALKGFPSDPDPEVIKISLHTHASLIKKGA